MTRRSVVLLAGCIVLELAGLSASYGCCWAGEPELLAIGSGADVADVTDGDVTDGDLARADVSGSWATPSEPNGMMSDWDLFAGRLYATTSPLWFEAEYLLWWVKGNPLPPLVTTSPQNTLPEQAGVLGEPGTRVLFGGQGVDDHVRSGLRTTLGVRLGHWFDAWMDTELVGDFLWLGDGQHSGDSFNSSSGSPILARPFFDVVTGQQNSQLVAFPGIVAGQIRTETSSDLINTGLLMRRMWRRGPKGRIDWLVGYRYMRLQEELLIGEQLEARDPAGNVPIGTLIDVGDRFATWNEFHGVDLGLQYWTRRGPWTAELTTKLAIGGVSRFVDVEGYTVVDPPGDFPTVYSGGLLALPSNMGRHHSTQFSMLPELRIKLRRRLTHSCILTLGYNLTLLGHVLRTGDQLDLAVNTTQLSGGALIGSARPRVPFRDQTLWVQGFNIGLQW